MPSRSSLLSLALLGLLISSAPAVPLVNNGDPWRYRKGTSAPQAGWQTLPNASLDATWLTGPGGFGYGDGDDATVLSDMAGASGYLTVYIRKEFTVGPGTLPAGHKLLLSVDYDDAYVAYLDGVEVSRSSTAPGAVGTEPAHSAAATTTREASAGNSSPQPPEVKDLGPASALLGEGRHVLAVLGLNESTGSSDFSLIVNLSTQSPPPPLHWTLADSPVVLGSTFTVSIGQTLLIDAGVEVRCPSGTNAINCQGVIKANGTGTERIRFVPSTSGGTWGRLLFTGSAESHLVYCDFERANSSGIIEGTNTDVNLDHCRFIDVEVQMVDLVSSSCTIQNCEFDSIVNNELLHFNNMPGNGHALIAYNRFGLPGVSATTGYNDIIDFTGGNRPGPIVRFIGNIFLSGVDDVFDMDGTDAHIEGNVFLNVNKESSRASSSNPITTGADGGNDSELVIARNFFVNCEHNVLIKNGGTVLIQNNSTLTMAPNPISNNTGEAPGIILFGEPWRDDPYGSGAYYEGNIAANLQITDPWPLLQQAVAAAGCFLRRDFNCIENFLQPGAGNLSADPLYLDRTGITVDNVREKLALQPGSPCLGAGPNGIDMGALVPPGASISGEPESVTSATDATLTVAGPGIWSYQWRLNGSPWSSEISLVPPSIWNGGPLTATMFDNAPPIELSGLADGTYTLEVIGRNSAGDWQVTPTVSQSWTVQTVPLDTDGDGMPDDYELANGFNPNDPSDADEDADADRQSNLAEFVAGTLPHDPFSLLAITGIAPDGNDLVVTFEAVAGKSYQLQSSPTLLPGSWTTVVTIPSAPVGSQSLTDAAWAGSERTFYRIVTPAPAP